MNKYRAKIVKQGGPNGGSTLHLIGDGSSSTICGIPGDRLTAAGIFDEVLCAQCLEEMPRPQRLSFPAES